MSKITYSPERKQDHAAIYEMIEMAFQTAEVKNGTEQTLYQEIKDSDKYIPELSIVALAGEEVIGHILASKAYLRHQDSTQEVLMIAPLAVKQELRKQGVGSQLLKLALQKARDLNYPAIFLLGKIEFYQRFGFISARKFNLNFYQAIPEHLLDNFMVLPLNPTSFAKLQGTLYLD